jgi:carboxylesterase type B
MVTFIGCSQLSLADYYAISNEDVFLYKFEEKDLKKWIWPEWLGDEIAYILGKPLNPDHNYDESSKVLRKMLKYWYNFVKYDNPNGVSDSGSKCQNGFLTNIWITILVKIKSIDSTRTLR